MKLKEAAKKAEDGIEETLTYCDFPSEHWTRIRTNWLGAFQPLIFNAFRPFFLQKDEVSGTLMFIVSVRSFLKCSPSQGQIQLTHGGSMPSGYSPVVM